MAISIRPLHPLLGAEVDGVDLRQPLEPMRSRRSRPAWTATRSWCFTARR